MRWRHSQIHKTIVVRSSLKYAARSNDAQSARLPPLRLGLAASAARDQRLPSHRSVISLVADRSGCRPHAKTLHRSAMLHDTCNMVISGNTLWVLLTGTAVTRKREHGQDAIFTLIRVTNFVFSNGREDREPH